MTSATGLGAGPAAAEDGCNDGSQPGAKFTLPAYGTNFLTNYNDAWRFYVKNTGPYEGATNYLHTYNKDGTTGQFAAFEVEAGMYDSGPYPQLQDKEVVTNRGTTTHGYFYKRSCEKK